MLLICALYKSVNILRAPDIFALYTRYSIDYCIKETWNIPTS